MGRRFQVTDDQMPVLQAAPPSGSKPKLDRGSVPLWMCNVIPDERVDDFVRLVNGTGKPMMGDAWDEGHKTLYDTRGNVQAALERSTGNEACIRHWTAAEKRSFYEGLQEHDKDFTKIQVSSEDAKVNSAPTRVLY
jgi:hypothetical protein